MKQSHIIRFQKKILTWYQLYGRYDLPWRKTRDPYRIFISELMLQQTQVDRVIPKYKRFIVRFPNVRRLARASLPDVLNEWRGLGYNRRAVYAKRTARAILRLHGGIFPRKYKHLIELSGIGPYTANAIRTFAWNAHTVFIETNIRRVFLHEFFPHAVGVKDSTLTPIIEKTLPEANKRRWYWALMDYGALHLKRVENPNRRSAEYSLQMPFEGSRRQARSFVLTLIMQKKRASLEYVKQRLREVRSLRRYAGKECAAIIEKLARDGLLRKRRNIYIIAS